MATANQAENSLALQAASFSAGERLLQASGLAVVVCLLAAGVVSPDPPSHGAPDAAVLAFYQQHTTGLLTGAFLWDLGMMALILFAAVLGRASRRAYLPAAGRSSALGQPGLLPADLLSPLSAAAAVMFVVAQAVLAAAAVIASHGSPAEAVRALDEISHMTGHLGTLPLGSTILAASLAQRLSRCSAGWIAWLGIVTGTALVATTSWVAFGHQWLHNAGVFALLAFLLWIAASSISLLRTKSFPAAERHTR